VEGFEGRDIVSFPRLFRRRGSKNARWARKRERAVAFLLGELLRFGKMGNRSGEMAGGQGYWGQFQKMAFLGWK